MIELGAGQPRYNQLDVTITPTILPGTRIGKRLDGSFYRATVVTITTIGYNVKTIISGSRFTSQCTLRVVFQTLSSS